MTKQIKPGYITAKEACIILGKNAKYLSNDRQKFQKLPWLKHKGKVLYKKEDVLAHKEMLKQKARDKPKTIKEIKIFMKSSKGDKENHNVTFFGTKGKVTNLTTESSTNTLFKPVKNKASHKPKAPKYIFIKKKGTVKEIKPGEFKPLPIDLDAMQVTIQELQEEVRRLNQELINVRSSYNTYLKDIAELRTHIVNNRKETNDHIYKIELALQNAGVKLDKSWFRGWFGR